VASSPFTGLQSPMRFKPPHCKRLQGAADAMRQARRRSFVLQVPDNKADAVSCERLPRFGIACRLQVCNGRTNWKFFLEFRELFASLGDW
jgi:hypothetical protein